MNDLQIISQRPRKTIYKQGDSAIKVFDKDYSKADVLNEALNAARVEETGLNIPKLKEVKVLEDGRWAIVMEYIQGPTLEALMQQHPEKEDEYLERFIRLQLKMHGYTVPLLNKLKDKMNRKISETSLDATVRYELHTRLESMPKHTKLCHGDFNPSNIIISDRGDYIVDWSHATIGNASADTARSYLLFYLAGEQTLAEKYLDKFCEFSGTAKKYVQNWIPIVAASQLVKNKPEERDFLVRWANVVEYD